MKVLLGARWLGGRNKQDREAIGNAMSQERLPYLAAFSALAVAPAAIVGLVLSSLPDVGVVAAAAAAAAAAALHGVLVALIAALPITPVPVITDKEGGIMLHSSNNKKYTSEISKEDSQEKGEGS